ncbi:MAG: mandelate racemase/muconate lactonizing enzyme family protein [Hyphomicrobiaceae bacterium]
MRVTDLRTITVELPLPRPTLNASGMGHDRIRCVLVFLDTDVGVTGESFLFTNGGRRIEVLEAMVMSLKPAVVGTELRDTERLWDRLWRELYFLGHKGVTIFGLAAIDTALWDAKGKALGASLTRLIGRAHDRIPVYASTGLWLSATIDELASEAAGYVAQGFAGVKMRVGKKHIEEDVERVAAVRKAIGPKVALMCDASRGFTPEHAVRLCRKLEAFGLAWFEEPVPPYDYRGSGRVAAAIDTPIASGETEATRYGFREMLAHGSADIWMADLARVGGVSEFIKVAHLAASHDIAISNHLFTEQSLSLLGAFANATWLEYMPWTAMLYRERLTIEDGHVAVPDRPGLGFTFDTDAIERYRVR